MSGIPALDYDYQNCIAYTTDMKVRLPTLNL
jgi:hypothetical protein